MSPEARSEKAWVASGWHVPVGYLLGFAVLLAVLGWHPDRVLTTSARWASSDREILHARLY